jgi:predicted dehydrogenase
MDGACILYPLRVAPGDGWPEGVSAGDRRGFAHDGSFDLVGAPWASTPSAGPVLEAGEFCLPSGPTRRVRWDGHIARCHPWKDFHRSYSDGADLGGGIVFTLSHPFDHLRRQLGEVSALRAMTGTLGNLGLEVEDTAEVGRRFASGCLGSVHLDCVQWPPAHDTEIVGEEGTTRWDNGDGSAQRFRPTTQTWETYSAPLGLERNMVSLEERRHFLAAIRREEDPLCALEDGIPASRLAVGALAPSQDGRLVGLSEGWTL